MQAKFPAEAFALGRGLFWARRGAKHADLMVGDAGIERATPPVGRRRDPQPTDRIRLIATITSFDGNDSADFPEWFRDDRGVSK
jgi:hypothetical protein